MTEHPPEHDPSSPLPSLESGRWAEATDHLWKTLQGINEWTRFGDAKAAAVLTADGVLGTLAAGAVEKKWEFLWDRPVLLALAGLSGLGLIASSFVCIKCINPELQVGGEKRSLLYFHHVAAHGDPNSFLKAAEDLGEQNKAFREIGTQVWANAKVASKKHAEVTHAIWLTGASLLAAVLVATLGGIVSSLGH